MNPRLKHLIAPLALAAFALHPRPAGATDAPSTASAATPAPEPTKPPTPMPAWVSAKLTTDSIETHRGEPGVVRLVWTTQSEQNSFGFNVMRGDNPDGKDFKATNDKIILGAGNSSTPNSYEYYDAKVKVGETHYYYLEQIDIGGNHEKISPVLPRLVQFRNLKALRERTMPAAGATTHALQPVLKTVEEAQATPAAEHVVAAAVSPTATLTPAPTLTPLPTATPTVTPKPKPTATPIPSSTPTPEPSATPSPAPTMTPTPSPTPSPAPTTPPLPASPAVAAVANSNSATASSMTSAVPPVTFQFAWGSDELTSAAQTDLDQLATQLAQNTALHAHISGHSDSNGTPQTNQAFAERRAWNAREYLINKGIARRQLILSPEVLHSATDENSNKQTMATDRRVEITVKQTTPDHSGA